MSLFDRMFDDAAVFPPGNAPLPVAIAEHLRHHQSWYASTVGPLVVPAARTDEVAQFETSGVELALTGRLDDSDLENYVSRASAATDLEVVALELVVSDATDPEESVKEAARLAAAVGPTTEIFIEDPDHSPEVLDGLASLSGRIMVKLRTGGVEASAFPSEAELGRWIFGCIERGLPFKCTAGLHHATRHTALDTRFEHHGFLNVILAVGAALDGQSSADLADVLSAQDYPRVVEAVSQLSPSAVAGIRDRFVSFGTCSVTEPINDLVAFGLLAVPGDQPEPTEGHSSG